LKCGIRSGVGALCFRQKAIDFQRGCGEIELLQPVSTKLPVWLLGLIEPTPAACC
jgi:hypothetical protein